MIPLKEEPTISSALCFGEEDAQHLISCQSTLAHAGNIVITSARHENLLAHYTRTMLAEINRIGGQAAAKPVAVRRMPKTSDGVLEALNEHLATMDLSALQTKRVVKTREIWLYEMSGPVKSELLQMAAPMIKQFKSAGVSIIVHSRHARPDSQHLKKLAETLRAKLVLFATPTEEECKKLAENVEGRPEASQIHHLIRSLGVAIEYDEAADLTELPAVPELSKLMQKAEQSLPVNRNGKRPQQSVTPTKASTGKLTAPKPSLSGVSNARILVSSSVACLLIAGLYFNPGIDLFEKAGNVAGWVQNQVLSESIAASNSVADNDVILPLVLPVSNPEELSQETATQGGRATIAANSASVLASNASAKETADVSVVVRDRQQDFAAPTIAQQEIVSDEESLKTLFPVITPSASTARPGSALLAPGVYVQHASFRLPQSALIWRNNNNQLPGVKVAAKGERFVAVSGPFADRGQARQYLADFGLTAQPYFVEGSVLQTSAQI